MTLFLLIVIFSAIVSTDASRNDPGPRNSVVVVGNPMSMICRSTSINDKIQWKFRNPNITGENTLYNGSHATGEFSVIINQSESTYTLTKTHIRLDDAGIYVCTIANSIHKNIIGYSAELIVLQPACNSSRENSSAVIEGEIIELWCEISFFKNPNPFMMWFRNGSEQLIPQNVIRTNKTILQKLTLTMNASDHGIMLSCLLYFNSSSTNYSHQRGVVKARNVPDFVFRWNFYAFVYYGPKDMMIVPEKQSYDPGDILHCSALGNPYPTFKWILLKGGFITFGPNLTIPTELLTAGDTYPWLCVATNSESGRNISKQIRITITNPFGLKDVILSTVLPSVLIPIVAGMLIILMIRQMILKRCSRGNSSKSNTADGQSSNYEDQGAVSSLPSIPNTDILLLSSVAITDNVAEDGTQPEIPLEGRRPYLQLSGVRPFPIPPIYAQLEMDDEPKASTESNDDSCPITVTHYANVADVRFTETFSAA